MCLTKFDEEEAQRIWHEDGYTGGLSKGLAEGETKKAIEAAKIIGLSLEEVQQLAEESGING